MTNFIRTERVVLKKGMLWRHIYAQKARKGAKAPMMVARVCEDGTQTSRNLDYCGMFGWRFTEPGQVIKGYSCTWTAKLDEWGNYTPSLANFCWKKPDLDDKCTILEKYPDFKWVLAKVNWSISNIFKALPLWKKNPRLMETLVSMDCGLLALNGSMYTAKDPWSIVKWVSRNMDCKSMDLRDIRLIMKGYDRDTVESYRGTTSKWNYINIDEWIYLFNSHLGPSYYNDYRRMCQKAGHDFKDPYWRYPKDLKKAHDKVMRECKRIDDLKRKAEAEKKLNDYTETVRKFLGKTLDTGSIRVFIPKDIDTIDTHARKLHQCLMSADYVSKVVKGQCVLVFIEKAGKPYATCELKPKGKRYAIGQFYGNERLKDYHAKDDARNALNEWAKVNKVRLAA